jgi:hypothetical protein
MARERPGKSATGADGLRNGDQEPAKQCTGRIWQLEGRCREAATKIGILASRQSHERLAESVG